MESFAHSTERSDKADWQTPSGRLTAVSRVCFEAVLRVGRRNCEVRSGQKSL